MVNLIQENNEAVQLLSGSRRKLDVSVPGENRPIFVGAAFLVLVGIVFGGLIFYLARLEDRISNLDNELIALEEKRDPKGELEILDWNKKLGLSGGLISNHIVWSQALQKLQNLTPPQVQFSSLGANLQEDKIEIRGTAPSYTIIAKTIAALSGDPVFVDLTLNKVSGLSSGLLEYDLRISFARDKLLLSTINRAVGGD